LKTFVEAEHAKETEHATGKQNHKTSKGELE
jgi:hypothetical protein